MMIKFLLMLAMVAFVGCSAFEVAKETIGMVPTTPDGEPIVKFSENPNLLNPANRQYKRMTKSQLEEEAELHAQAGSMWVMEGQGAYLFAQNKMRREGDSLVVRLEQNANRQVETKVEVIKTLLKQLEEELEKGNRKERRLAGATESNRTPAAEAPPAEKKDDKETAEAPKVDRVPSRITEKTADGNYRIKGQQPFMIGKREYKVIVTGLLKPEDFNDEGVSSDKLIDPLYDVVSIRKKESIQ